MAAIPAPFILPALGFTTLPPTLGRSPPVPSRATAPPTKGIAASPPPSTAPARCWPTPSNGPASQGKRGLPPPSHGSGRRLANPDQGLYIDDPLAAAAPFTALSTYSYGFYPMGSQANVLSAGPKVLMVPV